MHKFGVGAAVGAGAGTGAHILAVEWCRWVHEFPCALEWCSGRDAGAGASAGAQNLPVL